MKQEIKTLSDAIRYFADEQVCIDTVAKMRWPRGLQCPASLSPEPRQHWLKNQRRWQCRECGKQYSVKVNTIFEDSPIKLDKWITAMWLLANCKNGISSYEIARSIGVTQKSAWFMLQRIRLAMKNQSLAKLGNTGASFDVDETFIGGKMKNMHRKRIRERFKDMPMAGSKASSKTVVMGMLDRDTREVRAKVIPAVAREVLQAEILNNVAGTGTVYTDACSGYYGLDVHKFVHETVNRMQEYDRGDVHTNGIENFRSLLKREFNGTYWPLSPSTLSVTSMSKCSGSRIAKTKPNTIGLRKRTNRSPASA